MSDDKNMDLNKLFEEIAKTKEAGLETKISLLTALYNEQLNHLIRAEVDVDYTQYLMIAEPSDTTHAEKHREMEQMVRRKAKLVEIIRRHMLDELKGGVKEDEQKN